MSVREEDRRNKNCPNRGLGIAAAAIGVGVGAALYYIFSKRTENAEEDGASSSWSAEENALDNSSSSYTTVSEHSTSDTSINSSSSEDVQDHIAHTLFNQSDTESDPAYSITDDDSSESDNQISEQSSDQQSSDEDDSFNEDDIPMSADRILSDDETNMEFDVTRSSIDVPTDQRSGQRSRTPMMRQFGELTVRLRNRVEKSAKTQRNKRREDKFRERSWALEQCSICFDMMQREQEVLSLACTHRFHQACIMQWLEQQQTCPVCRKAS